MDAHSDVDFAKVIDAIASAILVFDARGRERRCLSANRSFTDLTGYDAASFSAETLLRLAGPDSDELIGQQLRAAVDSGAAMTAEWLIYCHDGTSLWARIATRRIDSAVVVTLEDISRHKSVRESLRASEARLEVAMAASELAMWDWNVPRDEVYYNDRWADAFGFDPRELLLREGLSERLLLPSDEPAILDRFEQHFAGRSDQFRAEYELRTRNGVPKWVSAYAKVVRREPSGQPLRVIGVVRDVTERNRELQDMVDVERRWERAVRGTSEGLFDWDLLTGHVWYASRFRVIIGYDEREFPDTFVAFQNVLHPDDRGLVLAGIRAHLENQAPLDVRCRVQSANGQALWCRFRGEAERDAAGRPLRLAGSLSDITAQIDAERALSQSQKMEAIGRLTGGIAHDFNNLLSVIVGNTQLLARSLGASPRLMRQAETAFNAAVRGAELTRRLLAFARQQVLEPKVVDLNTLIGGMYELLRRTLTGEIEIVSELDSATWPTKADPSQLENAILNLVINARDALPRGGVITIATRNATIGAKHGASQDDHAPPPGEYAVLEVKDTGVGMSGETLKRVFEPFFTTKEIGKGSGLGLAIVYGFIKQSGGHVSINSTPGVGTSVLLYFPRSKSSGARGSSEASGPADLPRGSETILVVESDAAVRATAVEVLSSLGYRLLEATNAQHALEQFMRDPNIALVFSDIMLPGGLLGTQLAQKLCERRPGLKILMTTGFSETGVMHRGLLQGSIDLLPKPYKVEDLARRIRAKLDGKEETHRVPA
jgi:PAS domain S-box-containing protein